MTLLLVLTLYVAFRIKQFGCDFLFQTDWMALNKGKPGWEGYKPLLSHAAVHGVGTLLIMLVLLPAYWWLAVVDVVVHAVVDRLKGVYTLRKGWTYKDRWFWWSFGLDQEAHNFTHLFYVLFLLYMVGGLTAA